MYFISQYGEHDCLFTCFTMMLANYHHDRNYLFLPHEDRQYNFREIIEESKKYQIELLGVKIPNIHELTKCKKFPVIVTLVGKNNTRHSVLLYKINRRNVYYYDPVGVRKKESLTSFSEKWTKSAIIVEKVTKMACPLKPPSFVAKKDKFTLPLFQLCSGASLLAGTYFIDKEYSIYVLSIFFACFVLFELLFRQNLINAMKRMDENLYGYKLICDKSHYYQLYQDVERYRYVSLTGYTSFIYSGLMIVFMTFILVINSKFNSIYVGMAMLMAFVEMFIYTPYFKQKSEEIVEEEKGVKSAENEYEFNHFSKEAREKSYKLGLSKSIFTYISMALFLLVIILVMVYTSTISITYIVFYLCISTFLKGEFTKFFTYATTSDDFDSSKNRVLQRLKIE